MRLPYDEPTEQPDPCCIEEPTYKDYGFPKPDLDTLVADLSPAETRALAKAALEIMADLGSETELREAGDHCVAITDILNDVKPGNLPTITEQYKPAARWWAEVGGVDPHDDDRWTEEEEA